MCNEASRNLRFVAPAVQRANLGGQRTGRAQRGEAFVITREFRRASGWMEDIDRSSRGARLPGHIDGICGHNEPVGTREEICVRIGPVLRVAPQYARCRCGGLVDGCEQFGMGPPRRGNEEAGAETCDIAQDTHQAGIIGVVVPIDRIATAEDDRHTRRRQTINRRRRLAAQRFEIIECKAVR